jgi:hypothetical protein
MDGNGTANEAVDPPGIAGPDVEGPYADGVASLAGGACPVGVYIRPRLLKLAGSPLPITR